MAQPVSLFRNDHALCLCDVIGRDPMQLITVGDLIGCNQVDVIVLVNRPSDQPCAVSFEYAIVAILLALLANE